jgi:L-asparaginase
VSKKVAFIGTGGTFSNAGTSPTDYISYLDVGEVLDAHTVLAMHPDANDRAQIDVINFGTLRSKWIEAGHWLKLSRLVTELLEREGYDAVVISHGTGTLEETAFFLHMTVASDKPVVIVGAQRPPVTLGSDAKTNFLDAILVATNPASGGRGVMVVMDRTIHSARDVTKAGNHVLDAMQSYVRGPLGVVRAEGTVEFYRAPGKRHTCNSEFKPIVALDSEQLPRVDMVSAYTEADGVAIDAFVNCGAKGLVVIGFAPGTATAELDAAMDRAIAHGVEIVLATRAQLDSYVVQRESLSKRKLIANTDITPQNARTLLQLCLASKYGHSKILDVFNEY